MEFLIVLAILAILAITILPNLGFFRGQKTVQAAAQELIGALRLAQNKTLSSVNASSYGVQVETDKFILFKGVVFDPVAADNETHLLGNSLNISNVNLGGGSTVVFERLSGATANSGSIKIEQTNNSSISQTVYIDASGTINLSSLSADDASRLKDSRHVHVLFSQNTKNALSLTLQFPADSFSQNINYQTALNAGKTEFSWQDTIIVNGSPQQIKIHTHLLSDTQTLFCIHRDRRFNSKALNVSLDGQNLINYAADGSVTQDASFWAEPPQIQ